MPELINAQKAGYDTHVAIVAGNPHGVTPAMIGAALASATAMTHPQIVTAAYASPLVGTTPTPVNIGPLLGLRFSIGDFGFRTFKIPSSFVGSPSVHVHWTKSTDANEATKNVKWRVSYVVFPGDGADVNVAPTVVDLDDTYDDAGTTTRIVYRTANGALTGFVAGYYIGMKIERVAPAGTPLTADPVLISLDMLMSESINV